MGATKSSILSLLFFGSFTVLATTECVDTSGGIILNSSEDESGASCKCTLGYSGTLNKESESKFSGTCTLIPDSKGVSSSSWVIPGVILGVTGTAIVTTVAIGGGYYIYRGSVVAITEAAGMARNITREEFIHYLHTNDEIDSQASEEDIDSIFDKMGAITREEFMEELRTDDMDSVFNEVHSDFDSANSTGEDFELNMTAEGYATDAPMNELLIKDDLVTESPAGDPDSSWLNSQTEGNSGEEINLEELGGQVKSVRENVMEEANLEEASGGGEEMEMGVYFEEQLVSDLSIPGITNTSTFIEDPELEGLERWEGEECII